MDRLPVRKRTSLQRVLPLGHLVVAVILAALLLPTALRPPVDEQSSTAGFSPDAPPEDTPPEVLLQAVRRASSSTAGGTTTEEVVEEIIIQEQAPRPRPRPTRGRCFGDPPRQTESLYSALCVPAWTGQDNGGRTAPGVFKDEIRIALALDLGSEVPDGRLEREFQPSDVDDVHHLKVWQTYFNERFEFYGRYLQFYTIRQSSTNADRQRESVRTAKSWDVFAMLGNGAAGVNEAIRLGIIDFGSVNNPVPFYNEAFPYAYSFYMDSWQTRYLLSEMVCKNFAGRPLGENNINERMDPSFDYDAPRKWGLITYQDETRSGATQMYTDLLARCGVELSLTKEYNLTDNQAGAGGIAAQFKAAGITTILMGVDGLTPAVLTSDAQNIQYFPEYMHAGTGGMDGNGGGRLMEDTQARHFIGLSPNEIPRADEDKDWYRAYKEIDPAGDPDSGFFRSLQQLSGGIQHAGPNLTPDTFWQGLKKQPYREPDPSWSIGGGYRESFGYIAYKDLTYMDHVSVIWFDQEGDDPDATQDGAWCHMWNGRRFKVGDLPAGDIPTDIPWRDKSQCITAPPEGVQG